MKQTQWGQSNNVEAFCNYFSELCTTTWNFYVTGNLQQYFYSKVPSFVFIVFCHWGESTCKSTVSQILLQKTYLLTTATAICIVCMRFYAYVIFYHHLINASYMHKYANTLNKWKLGISHLWEIRSCVVKRKGNMTESFNRPNIVICAHLAQNYKQNKFLLI